MLKSGYILRGINVIGHEVFYTGKAGDGWVDSKPSNGFLYDSFRAANRKAALFNKASLTLGFRFIVMGYADGRTLSAGAYEEIYTAA